MTAARGFIGSGDVYLNPFDPDTGLQTGWVYAGDADKFAIKPNSEIKERESKGRNTAGQVVATVAVQKPAELSITFSEANADNLTLAFMGKRSAINIAGAVVVDEVLTFKTTGGAATGASTAKTNLTTAAITLTSSDAATTYTKDVDYTVNYRMGLILPIAGSALATAIIAAGAGGLATKIDYTSGAIGGTKIKGGTNAQLRTAVKFDGKNQVDGSPALANVWEAVLTPQGEFDFLKDDWNDVQLQGRMSTPLGKDAPFEVDLAVLS